MSEDPLYIRILEKLGVNTTRLKWKLYQKERKVQDIARTGIRPKGLQWLSYPHKICSHCHAINDKEARECSSCNRRLPNMLIYKISRLLTSAASGESPVIIQGFDLLDVCLSIRPADSGRKVGTGRREHCRADGYRITCHLRRIVCW